MNRILYLITIGIVCIIAVTGCVNSNSEVLNAEIRGSIVKINSSAGNRNKVKVTIGHFAPISATMKNGDEFDLMDSLKNRISQHYELAYELANSKGRLNARLTIGKKLDTILRCEFKYGDILVNQGKIHTDRLAKIINTFDSEYIDAELRRWVYKNKKVNIGDAQFSEMKNYLRELSATTSEFIIEGEIPVMNDDQLHGISYKVSSNMTSDNYVLFACDKDEDIELFIEEMIAQNMPSFEKSLSRPLHLYKQIGESGVQCVFLVGINDDWTSQVIPLAVLTTDNSAPVYELRYTPESYTTLSFPKRGFTIDVASHPVTRANWTVSSGNWEGSLWYNIQVPFTFTWNGDIQKFVVHTGDGKNTTVNVAGKESPYHIKVSCRINKGDNYFEIEAHDKVGNIGRQNHRIVAQSIKDND